MEPHFGVDFSGVRVHTGIEAQRAAALLNARAFTYGRDIWLGEGALESDRRLMAHELTHVVQQGRLGPGKAPHVQRQEDEGFGAEFTSCMETLGLPVPPSLFTSVTTVTAMITAINAAVAKFGASVTVAELIGAGLLSEKLLVVGSLTASFYVGALTGCLARATGQSIADPVGGAIHDVIGPRPGLWIADKFGI